MINFDVVTYMFLSFFVLLFTTTVKSQGKYQKEERIREEIVPSRALDFMDELPFTSKLKWYKRVSLVDTTVVMKTKFEDVRYRIKFNKDGVLKYLENIIKWEEIPRQTQDSVSAVLSNEHSKFWIVNIRLQRSGSNRELIDELNGRLAEKTIKINYEIVLKAKVEGSYSKIVYLFSELGEMERKSIVIRENTDNLEY